MCRKNLFSKKMITFYFVFIFLLGMKNTTHSQPNYQFYISEQGKVLDRDHLFDFQPLGMITIKIIFPIQNPDSSMSIDLSQPRYGNDGFFNDVLDTMKTWQWTYPGWMTGVAYLTVNMDDKSIKFDVSDLWKNHNGNIMGKPIFPNPEKEKQAFLKFAGFNKGNITILLSTKYLEQQVKTASNIQIIWLRLTPWFFFTFIFLLLFAVGVILRYYAINWTSFIILVVLSIFLFFFLFDFIKSELLFIVFYWIIWFALSGLTVYLIKTSKGVLNIRNLDGDENELDKFEDDWGEYLNDTNTVLQNYHDANRQEAYKEWTQVVGIKLDSSIIKLRELMEKKYGISKSTKDTSKVPSTDPVPKVEE